MVWGVNDIATPTSAQLVLGDIAPADIIDSTVVPDLRQRHANPDAGGKFPFGRLEHGDGTLNIGDVVLDLRQAVGLTTVSD